MLDLLFPSRRRVVGARRRHSRRPGQAFEPLEERRLLAYTFSLIDNTGVTGTGPSDYSVYVLGFASYNSNIVGGKAFGQNAYVLGSISSPGSTSTTFADLSPTYNPMQGGNPTNIYPVKLDSGNLTFELPSTVPVEGSGGATPAQQLPTGRIYVFMVPNSVSTLPSMQTNVAKIEVGGVKTDAGLGFTGFDAAVNSLPYAYEVMEFTANTAWVSPTPTTIAGGSLDIDWTSVDRFQFPFTMESSITSPLWAPVRNYTAPYPLVNHTISYSLGTSNGDGTSFTRLDLLNHYNSFTSTNPAWNKLLTLPTSGNPGGILSPLQYTVSSAGALSGYFDSVLDDLYINGPPSGKTLYLQGSEGQMVWQTAPVMHNGAHALALWNPSYSGSTSSNPVWWIYDPRELPSSTLNAEYQIFSAEGAFSAANAALNPAFPTGQGLGTLLDMLNAAINRGIATSPGVYDPTTSVIPATPKSLTFWETQSNFYPENVPQNVYAQFFHAGMIGSDPINHPNTTAPQNSASGHRMGLAYGFAQDEKPGQNLNGDANLVSAAVNPQFQDNVSPTGVTLAGMIPTVPDTVGIQVKLGPWGTDSTVTVNAPQTFTVKENTPTSLTWPSSPVPFADTGATTLTVTLTVSGGTIAFNTQAATQAGLTVGTSAKGPTITGAITALNSFFVKKGNVTYTPIQGSVATQTLTTSAVDSQSNKASATSTIDIVAATAPVVNAPAVFTIKENTPTSLVWPAVPTPFVDASSQTLTVTLTVTGGSVAFNSQTATQAGLTVGGSPAAPSITGPITALNSYFRATGNVNYTPISDSVAGQTLTTIASDGSDSGRASSAIKIIAPTPPTPGTPTVTLTPEMFTTAVNTPVKLVFTGTPFAETGATPTTEFTVTMSTGGSGNGAISAASGSGVTVVTSGTGATFTGTLSALNTYFTTIPGKITYTPPANVQGTRTLSTVIAGNGKTSSPATTSIIVGANVAPTVAAPIAFWVPQAGRMNLVWPRGLTPFTDSDSNVLTVTLTTDAPASGGSFAASTADPKVTVVTTGDVVRLMGRPADLNQYFKTLGRMTYTAIGQSLQPRVLTVTASDGGSAGAAESALLARARGPMGVPAINATAVIGPTQAGRPLEITYDQLVAATGATTSGSRSVQFMLKNVIAGRLELWDGAKWVRVPATQPRFLEPLLAPGGKIRLTPPAGAVGQRAAFQVRAWDGWKMSGLSRVSVNVT